MTNPVAAPRYSAEDFETASIRSAAPSYVSEVPSYHSTTQHHDNAPAYTPRTRRANSSNNSSNSSAATRTATPRHRRNQSIGLPPVPSAPPPVSMPNLHNFRIPTWSASSSPAARHYKNVAERRVSDARFSTDNIRRYISADPTIEQRESGTLRPLEDPYLVGEEAASKARRERIARETGEDILIQEDKHWDWLLSQMRDWDERDRSWTEFRRDVGAGQHRGLLRRVGGRLF